MRSSCLGMGAGSTSLKRWPRTAMPANKPVRYSFCSVVKPAVSSGSGSVMLISVNVALITFFSFQTRDKRFCLFGAFPCGGFDDLVQSVLDVSGHARGVAADIK